MPYFTFLNNNTILNYLHGGFKKILSNMPKIQHIFRVWIRFKTKRKMSILPGFGKTSLPVALFNSKDKSF